MKLRDRNLPLLEPAVVKAMAKRSVYASMALEHQVVFLARRDALSAQTVPAPSLQP